ncbi:MAG: acyl-CoA synthetase [Thalassobaculum sp.]|uniref:acyl-CoA synthetase n=1 Tax=Thalassobaculum sp. TaxID=2022740 RepID=UPI0032EAADD3
MISLSADIVSGDRRVPAAATAARAQRIAGGLQALGVGPGDCVAILMRNDPDFLAATYGTMLLGAYAVPVNWHFRPEEIAYVLRDCGARAVFAHADLLATLGAAIPPGPAVVSVPVPPEVGEAYGIADDLPELPGAVALEAWLAGCAPYDGPALPPPQSMIYTSGTTGYPKGVRRRAPTAYEAETTGRLRALVYGLKPGIRAVLPGPLYHSAPNSYGVAAGRLGALVAMMPRFDPEGFLALVEAHRIDTAFMVPTMLIRLLKLPEEVRRRYDVSSIRHVCHAAAPCPAEVKRAMIEWWGPVIHEFYGGTETGPVTYCTSEQALARPGTVGRASPGCSLRFLDDDDREVPDGQPGEIYSRIDGYPDFTYQNDPDKRRAVERDGFLTCGDIGWRDPDGYVFLCDRKRDMVISGGVNIYPAEIEAVLHGLPGVQDCAVFGIPDPEFGEALMAVVEPQPGAVLEPEALRAAMLPQLAGYKVPRHFEIRTGLPREDSGKIFKRRLRDPYWEAEGRRI